MFSVLYIQKNSLNGLYGTFPNSIDKMELVILRTIAQQKVYIFELTAFVSHSVEN